MLRQPFSQLTLKELKKIHLARRINFVSKDWKDLKKGNVFQLLGELQVKKFLFSFKINVNACLQLYIK